MTNSSEHARDGRFELLELTPAASQNRFTLHARRALCTPFEFLYGGSAIAASVEAAEVATDRALQWVTTQFIGSPQPGDDIDIVVETGAAGRATSQIEVVASIEGRPMFTSLCALTSKASGNSRQFTEMPRVSPPEDCPDMSEPFAVDTAGTFFDHLERRVAAGAWALDAVDAPERGPMRLWCRIPDHVIGSPATQAFVADVIPLAMCAALGVVPGGTSLDNTVRVVDRRATEWVLLDVRADGYHQGIGHGSLDVWSQDGRLIGTAQQTCIIRTSHQRAAT
ncbi:MAG: thioesterase family protein [Actinomycetota bacterium]